MAQPALAAANGPNSWVWWHWVAGHRHLILDATWKHVQLTAIALGVGVVISFPLALLARRFRWLAGPILGVSSLGQLIYDGLLRSFRTPLVVGASLSVLLAVIADVGLAGIQRLVTPWAQRAE